MGYNLSKALIIPEVSVIYCGVILPPIALKEVSSTEVPNRRADRNKRAGLEKSATLLVYLLSKLINEQRGIFCLLHEKSQAGWKENLKNLSEHALLLGTSEYVKRYPKL